MHMGFKYEECVKDNTKSLNFTTKNNILIIWFQLCELINILFSSSRRKCCSYSFVWINMHVASSQGLYSKKVLLVECLISELNDKFEYHEHVNEYYNI